MMPGSQSEDRAQEVARESLRALRSGDRQSARRLAFRSLEMDPLNEIAWLILAALAGPDARRGYLLHLLTVHPESRRALQALEELEGRPIPTPPSRPVRPPEPSFAPSVAPSVAQAAPSEPPVPTWVPEPGERRSVGLRLASGLMRGGFRILGTLGGIAYLTLFGLILSERGREGLPAQVIQSAGTALIELAQYVVNHPLIYTWHKTEYTAIGLVAEIFANSSALLLIALGLAVVLGVPLGLFAALWQRRGGGTLALLISVLGVSTPSFLLAMVFWVINIQVHRTFDIKVLPTVGFGFDAHLILPALVLAARPLAQVAQITYVSLTEVLSTDYVRTARAKGLIPYLVYFRHAFRNLWIPILTTLGTSLRFSLASLPVVELFFDWPGVGSTLLEAIQLGTAPLVTDLIVSLGLFFLVVNQGLDWLFPVLNPALRESDGRERRSRERGLRTLLRDSLGEIGDVLGDLLKFLPGRGQPSKRRRLGSVLPASGQPDEAPSKRRSARRLRSLVFNPALVVGGLLVIGFTVMAVNGENWTGANAYQPHGVMMVEGTIGAPPYAPSSVFPWGTDQLGRDIQALVLSGARQTLSLAFFATLARLLLGSVLGMLAGWAQGGWIDQLVTGAMGVWAAFPVTLFAMILIQAIGIKQGMWVFVVALSVVGWGEVAQLVRNKVVELQPRLFVEAARSLGSRSTHILRRHLLPNLISPLLVVAVLEMGGVLMLLAELGFLNIFLGGGYQAMIAESGAMIPVIEHFSDIPEWGALLANIRQWWRAYPWMAWYPGAAFFLAIMAFNLLGEGTRRLVDRGQFDLSRLVNRYTVLASGGFVLLVVFWLRGASPIGVYRSEAQQFDTQRAMAHIQTLSSPTFMGRETGTVGAKRAAEYIAQQMQDIGLSPAGDGNSYVQTLPSPRYHVINVPKLDLVGPDGEVMDSLVYHQQFVDLPGDVAGTVEAESPIIGLALGPNPGGTSSDPYGLRNFELYDRIAIVRQSDLDRLNLGALAATLVVSDDPLAISRRFALPQRPLIAYHGVIIMMITPDVADNLLATAGSSLADLDRQAASLQPGAIATTEPGITVRMQITTASFDQSASEDYYNVIGFIAGTGSSFSQAGGGLDSQVVMVSAYYDGVGTSPDGILYPGANDNASGVATMLELARALKNSPYEPKRTVVFVAWAGGERREGLSVDTVMNAHLGFDQLTVEDVIELSGVGAGDGESMVLGQDSSYRLVRLFESAAGRLGYPATTRGRGPHYGFYITPGFGGREGLSLDISWDGSDRLAHTPLDTYDAIDPQKLQQVGQTTLLGLTVLTRETNY
jgi:peptide/nickel transport system permease protein